MRPIIGISPDFNSGAQEDAIGGNTPTYHIPERYVKALEHAGAIPFMLPYAHLSTLRPLFAKELHGLMMIGSGSDLDPRWYGEPPICSYPIMSNARSEFDIALAKAAWKANVPLFGHLRRHADHQRCTRRKSYPGYQHTGATCSQS